MQASSLIWRLDLLMLLTGRGDFFVNIGEVVEILGADVLFSGDQSREISGVVSGDLLSFIMAKGEADWAWITVQSHVNVAAVAVLKDMPLLVIAADRPVASDLIERCSKEGVTLIKSSLSSFEISGRLYREGLWG